MKKVFKAIAFIVLGILVIILFAAGYVKLMLPNVGAAPKLEVQKNEERVARGAYLANHVMVCVDCHSQRDWSKFSAPLVPGSTGSGGEVFDQKLGFPGAFVASNITPHYLGSWTDGEIFRAITTGVGKDGRALFSIMPYRNFGQLDAEDIEAVIAYIRTFEKIENSTTPSKADFPMNFILNTLPKKATLVKRPAPSDSLAYGKYLVTAANCFDCHTKMDKGKFVGEPFAGGFAFPSPDGSVITSANITPDIKTGIGSWTKEQFVAKFKMFADSGYVVPSVKPGEFQTIMPWTMYAGMSREDLGAIYIYLRTLPAVENRIVKFIAGKQ